MSYLVLALFLVALTLLGSLDIAVAVALAGGLILFFIISSVRGVSFSEMMDRIRGALKDRNLVSAGVMLAAMTALWRVSIPAGNVF